MSAPLAQAAAKEAVTEHIASGSAPPALTTSNSLETLKTLIDFNDKLGGPDKAANLAHFQKMYATETKFLIAASKAVSENPVLGLKFGTGMSGALGLASVLRQAYEDDLARSILGIYLPDPPALWKDSTTKTAFTRGTLGG